MTPTAASLAEEARKLMLDFAEEVWQAGTEGFNTQTVAPCREARAKAEAAIDALAQLAVVQPAPQWISVDDRLPDTFRRVLACNTTGYVRDARYQAGDWYGIGGVNGWMELPKPLPAAHTKDTP